MKGSLSYVDMGKRSKNPRHELLGSRATDSPGSDLTWHNVVDIGEVPWLAQHVLINRLAFPAAGYIAMAGESMRQLSNGNLDSYALSNFSIKSALLPKIDEKIELSTRLRPMKSAGGKSEWYEISITSYDGHHRVERCIGKVSPHKQHDFKATKIMYPEGNPIRDVTRTYWYDVLSKRGVKYGPAFQGLDNISASVTEQKAKATISAFEDITKYILHPVTMDKCLQILMVAACNGQGRQMKGLSVIQKIENLVVCSGRLEKLKIAGMGANDGESSFTGDVSAVTENGDQILSVSCCETVVALNDSSKSQDELFSFVEWDTDPTYYNLNRSLAPFHSQLDSSILLERFALLHLLDTKGSFSGPGQMHLQRIYDGVTSRKQSSFGLISDPSPFKELDDATRKAVLESIKTQFRGTAMERPGTLIEQLLTSSAQFTESNTAKEKMLDQCHPISRNNGVLARVLGLLAHKNPTLRILEIGNGIDQTTRLALDALRSNYGERMYSTYTYAATSPDATRNAKETFSGARNIDVVEFDVNKKPQGRNLQAGAYDLIITTDFISPARDVSACVSCLKHFMHPNGRLLLLDIFPEPRWASLVKGHLSDWSPTSPAAYKDENFINQVHAKLDENEFAFAPENNGSSTAPKAVAHLKKPPKNPKKISLVVPKRHHPLVNAVQMSFQKSGIKCDRRTLEDDLPQGQDIISLVDFGEPYVYNITEANFRDVVKRFSDFKGSMIWVTPSAQISCKDPNSSMILGLTRTLRAELRKDITTVEIDVEATTFLSSSRSLFKIYQDLGHRPKLKNLDPDYEYAIVDGEIKIPRIHWATGEKELSNCVAHSSAETVHDVQTNGTTNGTSSPTPIHFRSDASYLLVGGLGGLGRLIATWMVENGARSIIFLSRSAKEGPETTPFFDELRLKGCEVSAFAGSVNNISDVETAVKQATKPVAGVIQMSAVMRDNWMSQMSYNDWEQCVRPKVQGTWNLHHATATVKLDFFLLFSSICGMSGQWGQANYNAANSFLDAFVNYRHSQDLPASVADIGFMGEIGMAMENLAMVDKFKASGYQFLGEQDLIDALTIAINHSRPEKNALTGKSQLGLGFASSRPITDPSTRVVWKKDARWAFSHQLGALGTATADEASEALNAAYRKERVSA
ncbi:MAG: hypothetical protein Q9160_006299 [Pyrenula sp. 1 TL-2023]